MNTKNDRIIELPHIGMGTFGSDRYDAETVANSVYTAIKVGYRMFDCASVYGNEKEIGEVFAKAISDGLVKREQLVITSKVWNDMHGEGEIISSCRQSLKDLGLDYIDIYFMHWPFPNYHARGCAVESRNPNSRPFFADEYIKNWREMEWLKEQGLVREIAMSNMTIPKFEAILPQCKIKPFAHEMELHPSFQQRQLVNYCKNNNIVTIGYCPLGSPNRPERDKMPEDISDTQMPEVVAIAKKHSIHPAEVCLRWSIQHGKIPIPFASCEANILNNLRCAEGELLTADEMAQLDGADKDCRLVKGHVFLWSGAKDWTDLWDINNRLENWKLQNKIWIMEQ